MENAKIEAPTIFAMFEEMKDTQAEQSAGIKAILEKLDATPPASETATTTPTAPLSVRFGSEDRAAIRTLFAKLDENDERIQTLAPKIDTVSDKLDLPQKLRHTFNLEGNWGVATLIFTGLMLFVSLSVIDHQRETIAQLRDNDLKYRHIEMQGAATPANIEHLCNVFDWNRNTDSIRTIRRRVVEYEQLVQQEAEKSERARLNYAEAERLKKAAETVKKGK